MSLLKRIQAWSLVAAVRCARKHEYGDQAAALTYYAVLSLFPGILVLVSLLGLVGDPTTTVDKILQMLRRLLPADAVDTLTGPIQALVQQPRAGLALVIGVLLGLWSASGYISVFMRVMNTVDEVHEGRSFVRRTALRIALTVALLVLTTVVAFMLVSSSTVLDAIGQPLGLSQAFVDVWGIVRWPLAAALFVLAAATLFTFAPNAQKPFRIATLGGLLALVMWLVGSVAFAVYVSRFGSYNKTYGTLGGAIVAIVWLWLTNVALVLGAEWDAELTRRKTAHGDIEEDFPAPADEGLEEGIGSSAKR